jgi:activator of HSP90 ATPase
MKTIKQAVTIKSSPHAVFEAFMDSKRHSKFTGDKAVISRKVSGKFTAFNGYADGKNLEIIEDKKIVQTWRASDWPENHYSTITLILMMVGAATKLTFTQTDVPDDRLADIKQGWTDFYWKPMKAMLEQK